MATLVAGAVLLPAGVRAERASWIVEEDEHHGEFQLSVQGGWYWTGVGGELRMAFPIVPDGAIDYLNESFALEIGGGYQFFFDRTSGNFHRVSFPVAVRWDFHLTTMWSVYGMIGVVPGIPIGRANPDVFFYHGYIWPLAAVGAWLHLGAGFALRMEAGSMGILAGVTWSFAGGRDDDGDADADSGGAEAAAGDGA